MYPKSPGHSRHDESGTVLLMAAVTIVVIVGMLALAVDVGYLMSGRGQLQTAVDSAALAAAQGTRTAIEPPGIHVQQSTVVRALAREYASANRVKRVGATSGITLEDSDITIDYPSTFPVAPIRVLIKHRVEMPVIFGNIFGINSLPISAAAIGGATYVDGGTGMISGCWRPILMPDTFNDKDGNVWAVCGTTPAPFIDGRYSPARPASMLSPTNPNGLALEDGDYYVSRYASLTASSDRNALKNFTQRYPAGQPLISPTGIRDAQSTSEASYANKIFRGNLMGQRMLVRPSDYRLVNFSASGLSGEYPTTLTDQLKRGCCTPIRVGQLVQVYTPTSENQALYANFYADLFSFFTDLIIDTPVPEASQYRYAQSVRFRAPNSSPRVLPVLFCSPIQYSISKNTTQFYITNIGAFTLENVLSDGTLIGYFAREVVTAGTALEAKDDVPNRGSLPISVNLVR